MNEQDQSAGPGPDAGGEPGGQPAAGGPGPEQHRPTQPVQAGGPRSDRARRVRHALTSRAAGWVAAAVLAGAVTALAVVDATASPVTAGPVAFRVAGPVAPGFSLQVPAVPGGPVAVVPGGPIVFGPGRQFTLTPAGIHARLAGPGWAMLTTPFGKVVAGTVGSVSGPAFTITANGRAVTVHEQSSTVYWKAGKPASASAVTKGARVAAIGSLGGSVLTANMVAVLS